jgi:CRISPR-associated protein Csb2
MASKLCLKVTFLAPEFHGRCDRGAPEWPPSPLRLFQSLVATAAARSHGNAFAFQVQAALAWLSRQAAPTVVAPRPACSSGYRLSVPNNSMDIVAAAWSRGNESNSGDANPATHRTMKTVRPTYMLGSDTVYFVWSLPDAPLTDEAARHVRTLCDIVRSVAIVGWGFDMVVGHGAIIAEEQSNTLPGEHWLPTTDSSANRLRVPTPGTLDALAERHKQFLGRQPLASCDFNPPDPLSDSAFRVVGYRKATDPPPRSIAAFSLLKLDASGYRAFSTARRSRVVAGMVRRAAASAGAEAGWPEERINTFILGHGEGKSETEHRSVGSQRFAFLPLPSIESRGSGRALVVGSIRRILVTAFSDGCEAEVVWARRALSGQELKGENTKNPTAILSLIPESEKAVRNYTRRDSCWATVTPVVLPGFDDPDHLRRRADGTMLSTDQRRRMLDKLSSRIDGLLRKAIRQAGLSDELAKHAAIEWRTGGFWPGNDLAGAYGAPEYLKRFPRYHVRIEWRDSRGQAVQVPGPICIGGGRYFGLGLFAAVPEQN